MSKVFIHELEELKEEIAHIGELTALNIRESVAALKEHDKEKAEKVFDRDKIIDRTSHQVESRAATLLALYQPMARDLRELIACIRINIDLERMSDMTVSIAGIAIKTLNEEHVKPLVDIPKMAEISVEMLTDALKHFKNGDADEVIKIAERDDEIDQLYDQVRRELITYMIEDPKTIKNASDLLFAAKRLERVGDHITNICESIVYAIDGRRVELN